MKKLFSMWMPICILLFISDSLFAVSHSGWRTSNQARFCGFFKDLESNPFRRGVAMRCKSLATGGTIWLQDVCNRLPGGLTEFQFRRFPGSFTKILLVRSTTCDNGCSRGKCNPE